MSLRDAYIYAMRNPPVSNVVKFDPVIVGEGFRFDADELLESAKGKGLMTMAIIGELEDGTLWLTATANAGETLVLMEKAKHQIVFGDDE